MTHREAIRDLITHIVNQGLAYVELIDKGNAFDKIIRNYHQFNSAGQKVSSNKRSKDHYKFSVAAWQAPKQVWYWEHLVPIAIIKEELKALADKGFSFPNQVELVLEKTEYVVITKSEAKHLDSYYKSTLPENGQSRLEAVGIEYHPDSLGNKLWEG